MAYYENKGQLQRQYELIRSFPQEFKHHIRVIVVDDCSEKNPAHKYKIGCPVEVFRILPPKVMWNQDAARNIGVHNALTKWLLLTDIDHMVPLNTWEKLIFHQWSEGEIYTFKRVSAQPNGKPPTPYHPHPNTWFMTKDLYDHAGGYDERFAGWYGTDADFRERVKTVGHLTQMEDVIIRVGREVVPDASTVGFPRKDQPGANEAIRRIKAERSAIPGWRPLTMTFPYERVRAPC